MSKPSKLVPNQKNHELKSSHGKFFYGCPWPGLNQGPSDSLSNALSTEPRRRKDSRQKIQECHDFIRFMQNWSFLLLLWSILHESYKIMTFLNFLPGILLPPWLSGQRVRQQIQRSLVQSRPGTPMKKIYRGRISIHGFSDPLGTKYDGLDTLFSGKEPFI